MNEAFTIGNNNSIYTFGPKIIVLRQVQFTEFGGANLRSGQRMTAPRQQYSANVTGQT